MSDTIATMDSEVAMNKAVGWASRWLEAGVPREVVLNALVSSGWALARAEQVVGAATLAQHSRRRPLLLLSGLILLALSLFGGTLESKAAILIASSAGFSIWWRYCKLSGRSFTWKMSMGAAAIGPAVLFCIPAFSAGHVPSAVAYAIGFGGSAGAINGLALWLIVEAIKANSISGPEDSRLAGGSSSVTAGNEAPPPLTPGYSSRGMGIVDELERLSRLKKDDLLTEEEFREAKTKVLGD